MEDADAFSKVVDPLELFVIVEHAGVEAREFVIQAYGW